MPWGGIYPGVRGALASLPLGERLRSFHVHSYCMIPDCRLESQLSYRFGADYVKTLYGSANEAREALQVSKLNYFLISTDLAIQDPLARSPLFDPNSIAQHMGVVWTDGVTSLLTWKTSKATLNITEPWLIAYRNRVFEDKIDLMTNNSTDKRIAIVLSELERRGRKQDLKDVVQSYWSPNIDNLLVPSNMTQPVFSPENNNGKELSPSNYGK